MIRPPNSDGVCMRPAAIFVSETEGQLVFDSVLAHERLIAKGLYAFRWLDGWRIIRETRMPMAGMMIPLPFEIYKAAIKIAIIKATRYCADIVLHGARPGVDWWALDQKFLSDVQLQPCEVAVITPDESASTAGAGVASERLGELP